MRNTDESSSARMNILDLVEGFIEQIQNIRKILLGVSVSAIVLAPLAIGLSAYLVLHPSFFFVLETENEFGLVLTALLGAVITISAIWLGYGIRQYRSVDYLKKRYDEYSKEKEDMDRKIASKFGLDQD